MIFTIKGVYDEHKFGRQKLSEDSPSLKIGGRFEIFLTNNKIIYETKKIDLENKIIEVECVKD